MTHFVSETAEGLPGILTTFLILPTVRGNGVRTMIKKHQLSLCLFLFTALIANPLLASALTAAIKAADAPEAERGISPSPSSHLTFSNYPSEASSLPDDAADTGETTASAPRPIALQSNPRGLYAIDEPLASSPPISIARGTMRQYRTARSQSGSFDRSGPAPLTALTEAQNYINNSLGIANDHLSLIQGEEFDVLKIWMKSLEAPINEDLTLPSKTTLDGWQVYCVLRAIGKFDPVEISLESPINFSEASFDKTFPTSNTAIRALIPEMVELTTEDPNVEMMVLLAQAYGYVIL